MDSSTITINDLPQEILFDIFSQLFTSPITISKAIKIWRIARVCKRWMSLILAMEHWWGDMALKWSDFYHGVTVPINFLDRCIHFSGNHQLSVTISTARGINAEFVQTLQKVSDRLRRFTIEVLTDIVKVFEESPVIIHAPNLEHLDIAQLDDVFVDVSDFLAGIQVSPSLSSLAFRRLSLLSVPKSPTGFPWHSITTLALSIYTSDSILVDLLSKTVNLTSLSLLGAYIERHAPPDITTLEKLSELTLDSYTSSYLASTFKSLHLPSLKKVHYIYGEFSAYKQIMSESLFKQASHIRKTVAEVIVEDVHLALGFRVANSFPKVRELTIADLRPRGQHGDSLQGHQGTDSSYADYLGELPFLQSLCIKSGSVSKEDLRSLLSLVAARNEAAEQGHGKIGAITGSRPARIAVHLPILSGMKDAGHMSVIQESGLNIGTDIII
ncbi:hypothetical protein M378DRAFT_163355 [Amanita muscaria Koide BX008]|uniref:F-box domain-containing protein n=1 Tax=Amanita muscaria (strain Koide BX008) TaxID=946122 RepID=A0A0C2X6G3_AMAMK|nr:hypothetical protein M378DRAFT_163355 [Amanita muscaria Koide BX008]